MLKVKRLSPQAILPKFATAGAACFDLHTITSAEVLPHSSSVFETGLSFEIPPGHVMLVFSRSGHGFKNSVRLSNCVGVIDSDYRGQVMVKLHNDSSIAFGFEPGDRIAQAMLVPVPSIQIEEVVELSETARGSGGFGSTGT